MKTKLPCAIVRDLLPSYIEGLTEEETTAAVKDHLDDCGDCAARYAAMIGDEVTAIEPAAIDQEVDYLKTVRKKSWKKVIIAVVLAVVLVLGIVGVRFFLVGWVCDGSALAVTPTVSEDGQTLHLNLSITTSATTILGYKMQTNEDGVITITAREALASPFHDPTGVSTMELSLDGVSRVEVCGTTVWQAGTVIDYHTSRLLDAATPYVGDAPAMGRLVSALDLDAPCTMELQTSSHPYGITLRFSEPIDEHRRFMIEGSAYLLLALTGNLEEVRWSWPDPSREMGITKSLTLKQADGNLPILVRDYNAAHGTDLTPLDSLKDYGADSASLQQLRNILGI